MRAIVVEHHCEPQDLRVGERRVPEPGPGEALVEVFAAGANFADVLIAQGRYQVRPELPFVPGAELAGIVKAVGANVTRILPGDRVVGAPGTGAFAELAVVPAERLYALPDDMDFDTAAALPIVYGTAYGGLVFRADLQAGETLLVHAAAGGVGSAAVQIGRALGARVLATAGGSAKCELAHRLGAELAIDYRAEDFVERVNEATQGRGADVIFDSVGGDTFDRSLKCIAWNGRHVVVGFASGRIPEVAANRIMLKNVSIVGVHWSAYPEREPSRVAETFAALYAMHADGRIRPEISRRVSLDDVPGALAELAARRTVGKLIVHPQPSAPRL